MDRRLGEPANIEEIRRLREGGGFETTTFDYDANGQLTRVTPPAVTPADGLAILRTYHASGPHLGRLQSIGLEVAGAADPHLARSFTYDTRGNVETVTDARGNVTTYGWDAAGRLTSVENELGETTSFGYSGPNAELADPATAPLGRFLAKMEIGETASEGQVRRFRWSAMGNLVSYERKDDQGSFAAFESYTSDSDGNRLSVTDLTGRITSFGYDLRGQLETITDSASSANITTFGYDAAENRSVVTDAKGRVTTFTYDDLDRLVEVDQTDEGLVTAFGYDAAGNVTTVTDPKSQTTTYEYDLLSRLTEVIEPLDQPMQDPDGTVSYAYDARGRLEAVTNARDHVLRYAYFPWGGLAAVEHFADDQAATPDRTVAYTYDLAGNLRSASDTELVTSAPAGTDPALEPAGRLYTYAYDPLGRVDVATAHYIPGGDRT